jgi:glycosyltransferase involved in cell wall biosynthesis
MIGDGPDVARLKHLATDLGLRESVEFVGLVPHKDVPRWLSESDTCVHVANDMCTATKVTEYMAARKPVVIAASWWNKYRQFLENGVNCVLVPLDAEKLAAAISHLLEDSLKAEQMAENGFKTMSLWTLKNMSDKKMALIEKLTRTA